MLTFMLVLTACGGPYGAGWGDAGRIHKAAHFGNIVGIRRAVAAGEDPNAVATVRWRDPKYFDRKRYGTTPLELAVRAKRLDAVKVLLESGATIEPKCLPPAVSAGEQMVRLLLDAGWDVNRPIDEWPQNGGTVLHWAVMREDLAVVRLLIDRGADVDAPAEYLETPLMAFGPHAGPDGVEVAKVLLAAGADPQARAKPFHSAGQLYTPTPVSAARNCGRRDIEAVLLEAMNATVKRHQ